MSGYEVFIRDLRIRFSNNSQLEFGDMDFPSNKICVLHGVNGCGKTTLLKAIHNLILQTSGVIMINGDKNSSRKIQQSITSFFDKDEIFDFLTPIEYFNLIASNYGKKKNEISKSINYFQSKFQKQWNEEKKLIRNYSDGNIQLIGIVAAMITGPKLLLLDEPFNFLDEQTKKRFGEILCEYQKQNNSTIIMSSNMDVREYLSNYEIKEITSSCRPGWRV